MFFLKEAYNGLKKKNIIYIENFLDPITKSKLLEKKFKIKQFNIQDTKFQISKDIKLCNDLNKRFLNDLRNFYKIQYNKKVDYKILNFLIGKWSYSYISNFIYKYKLLKFIKKKYPKFAVINFSSNKNYENEMEKYYASPASIFFINKFYSDIAYDVKINLLKVNYEKVKNYIFPHVPLVTNKRNFIFHGFFLKSLISFISVKISNLVYGRSIFLHDHTLNFISTLKLIYRSKFKFSYLFISNKGKTSYKKLDHNIFKFLKNKKTNDKLYNLVLKNLEFYIPKEFQEYFYKLAKINYLNKIKAKNMLVSKSLSADDHLLKIYLLNNFKSTKILGYQHGGGYGQEKNLFQEKYERSISNHFLSWGWKGQKVIPMPMQYPKTLKKFKTKIKKKYGSFCLFVSWSMNHNYFSHSKMPETYLRDSLIPSYKFLEKISKKKETYIRLPPFPKFWKEDLFLKKLKNIKFDLHEYEYEKMAFASDFVVINHFNTTALQSISLNIPTFMCCNKNYIEFNSVSKKYLNELISSNIFFYNFNDLYNFLNKIDYDIENWWNSKKVQRIKKNFSKNYCLRSNSWQEIWIEKLTQLNK